MNRYGKISFFVLVFLIFLTNLNGSDTVKKQYSWHGFEFDYPASWTINLDKIDNGRKYLSLDSESSPRVSLQLTLMESLSFLEEKHKKNPVLASVAFGLSVALRLAGDKKNKIGLSYGQITLSKDRALLARFTVPKRTGQGYIHVDSFHQVSGSKVFFGMIMHEDIKAGVLETSKYSSKITEVYEIIKSITIK